MKAIEINSKINLTNGLSTISGAIVVISEALINVKSLKGGFISCQVITLVFASLAAYNGGKSNIDQIQDFDPSFMGVKISVNDYEKVPTQDFLISVVQTALELIYPGKISIIDL